MKTKAYVVGGGIFGSLAARALQSKGIEVTIFDCNKTTAGSKPAACLMKPSWMTSLDYKPALSFLEREVGLEEIQFRTGPLGFNCFWSSPHAILDHTNLLVKDEKVIRVSDGVVETENSTYSGLVVVAAGVWSFSLLPEFTFPEMRSLCGSAVIGKGSVQKPTIYPYAPYKQAVWFNRGDNETWFGDGTSIIKKNFNKEHVDRTVKNSAKMAEITGDVISGQRPYVKTDTPGFFQKLGNNLYVSTGGAKNGTVLAALQSLQLLKHV